MIEKKTSLLNDTLQNVHGKKELDEYINKYTTDWTIRDFFNQKLFEKNMKASQVLTKVGMDRDYGNQILNGRKVNPGRDYIIGLCIGLCLSLDETQRALKIANKRALYEKDKRDVIIRYYIEHGKWDIDYIDRELESYGFEIIQVSKDK